MEQGSFQMAARKEWGERAEGRGGEEGALHSQLLSSSVLFPLRSLSMGHCHLYSGSIFLLHLQGHMPIVSTNILIDIPGQLPISQVSQSIQDANQEGYIHGTWKKGPWGPDLRE